MIALDCVRKMQAKPRQKRAEQRTPSENAINFGETHDGVAYLAAVRDFHRPVGCSTRLIVIIVINIIIVVVFSIPCSFLSRLIYY